VRFVEPRACSGGADPAGEGMTLAAGRRFPKNDRPSAPSLPPTVAGMQHHIPAQADVPSRASSDNVGWISLFVKGGRANCRLMRAAPAAHCSGFAVLHPSPITLHPSSLLLFAVSPFTISDSPRKKREPAPLPVHQLRADAEEVRPCDGCNRDRPDRVGRRSTADVVLRSARSGTPRPTVAHDRPRSANFEAPLRI